MALGKNIAAFRASRGWTLETLAAKATLVGPDVVDVGTISALENRDSKMSKYARQIAGAFERTIDQLIAGHDRSGESPAVFIQPPPIIINVPGTAPAPTK